MAAVTNAVFSLILKAKPLLDAKRWWASNLTELQYIYSRNKARSIRKTQILIPKIEKEVKEAARIYYYII